MRCLVDPNEWKGHKQHHYSLPFCPCHGTSCTYYAGVVGVPNYIGSSQLSPNFESAVAPTPQSILAAANSLVLFVLGDGPVEVGELLLALLLVVGDGALGRVRDDHGREVFGHARDRLHGVGARGTCGTRRKMPRRLLTLGKLILKGPSTFPTLSSRTFNRGIRTKSPGKVFLWLHGDFHACLCPMLHYLRYARICLDKRHTHYYYVQLVRYIATEQRKRAASRSTTLRRLLRRRRRLLCLSFSPQ